MLGLRRQVSFVPTGDIALAFLSTEEIATEMALSKAPDNAGA
jgi:hypothetical protein